ncbi:hypothetical protein KFE25_010706 [Diacronema lutheri]|uniref:Uncharacterized protein n=1 Tax=Diacronema lutheri TaxID=2081491 RepID=A0A8J6C8V1_DIALT|nr:hypothetical protein KFE25_010706 [Diacronema lutheri]
MDPAGISLVNTEVAACLARLSDALPQCSPMLVHTRACLSLCELTRAVHDTDGAWRAAQLAPAACSPSAGRELAGLHTLCASRARSDVTKPAVASSEHGALTVGEHSPGMPPLSPVHAVLDAETSPVARKRARGAPEPAPAPFLHREAAAGGSGSNLCAPFEGAPRFVARVLPYTYVTHAVLGAPAPHGGALAREQPNGLQQVIGARVFTHDARFAPLDCLGSSARETTHAIVPPPAALMGELGARTPRMSTPELAPPAPTEGRHDDTLECGSLAELVQLASKLVVCAALPQSNARNVELRRLGCALENLCLGSALNSSFAPEF